MSHEILEAIARLDAKIDLAKILERIEKKVDAWLAGQMSADDPAALEKVAKELADSTAQVKAATTNPTP